MSLDKSGVLHIPLSNYAFSIDENTLCLRIRAKINNVKEINLFYGDTAYPSELVLFNNIKVTMESTTNDSLLVKSSNNF